MSLMYEDEKKDKHNNPSMPTNTLGNITRNNNQPTPSNFNKSKNPDNSSDALKNINVDKSVSSLNQPPNPSNVDAIKHLPGKNIANTVSNKAATSASKAVAGKIASTAAGGPIAAAATAAVSLIKKINPLNDTINIEKKHNNIGLIVGTIIIVPIALILVILYLLFSLLPGPVVSLYLAQYETTSSYFEEEQNQNLSFSEWVTQTIKSGLSNIFNNFTRPFYDDSEIIGYEGIDELQEFNTTNEFQDSYEANMRLLDKAIQNAYEYNKELFIEWCEDNNYDIDYSLEFFPELSSIGEIDYLTYLACVAQSKDYNLDSYTSKKFQNFLLSEESYQYLLKMEIEVSEELNSEEETECSTIPEGESSIKPETTILPKKIDCNVTFYLFTEDTLSQLFDFDIHSNHYQTGIPYETAIMETKMMLSIACGELDLNGTLDLNNDSYSHIYENNQNKFDIDLSEYKVNVIDDINKGYYTAEDYAYMVAVMSSEGSLSYECAVAVGYCVLYRCEVNNLSIKETVCAPNQFCSPWIRYIGKPVNNYCATAAVAVLKREVENPVKECYFFFTESAVVCVKPGVFYKNVDGNLYYKKWGDVHTIHSNSHTCIPYRNRR